MKRIENALDIERGLARLLVLDPQLRPIAGRIAEIPLRLRKPGFEGLAEIITSQQVSKASAAAIFARLTDRIDPFDAETFLRAGERPLVEAGLSRAKQATLTGLATAIAEKGLDLDALCQIDSEDAMTMLVALKGIGPWTAEVFLLFCAGHPDIFPAGDVALQHAVGHITGSETRPDERQTRAHAARWAPYRGIAARLMWAHYAILKGGGSAVPL